MLLERRVVPVLLTVARAFLQVGVVRTELHLLPTDPAAFHTAVHDRLPRGYTVPEEGFNDFLAELRVAVASASESEERSEDRAMLETLTYRRG